MNEHACKIHLLLSKEITITIKPKKLAVLYEPLPDFHVIALFSPASLTPVIF